MKHPANPKRFFMLAFLFLNCYFLYSQKHIADWFIGTNTTIINNWKINPDLKRNEIPQLRTEQFGIIVGLNAYYKKFILTSNLGIGFSQFGKEKEQNTLRQGLIELDLKYTLWNERNTALSAGVSYQYRHNEVDIVKSGQQVDLGTDPFAGQGTITMSIEQYAIGPSVRVNFFQNKDFDPQLICSYTIGVRHSPWISNGKQVLNSPRERQNCFNFKLLFPLIYR